MIEGYRFGTHVLPRMLPALTFVTLACLAWLVPLRTAGAGRWVLLGVVIAVTLAVWVIVSAFVRRLPNLSRTATIAILTAFAAMPIAVPLLQLGVDGTITPPGGPALGLLGFVVFFAAVFAVTVVATAYGIGALLRSAFGHALHDMRNSVRLLGRALPMMLFVTLFLFFTGELWQAMNEITWWRLALVVALFAAVRRVRQYVLRRHVDERRRPPAAVLRADHRRGRTHPGRAHRVPRRSRLRPALVRHASCARSCP